MRKTARKPTKASHAREMKFRTAIESRLADLPGTTWSTTYQDWHVKTSAGPMRVSFDTSPNLFTVFCRFEGDDAHLKLSLIHI